MAAAKEDVENVVEEEAASVEAQTMSMVTKDVVSRSVEDRGGHLQCPWCGYVTPTKAPRERAAGLSTHLEDQHSMHLASYAMHPDLGLDAYSIMLTKRKKEEEELMLIDELGLNVTDELDDFDYLAVPDDIKKAVETKGGGTRWCTEDNIRRFQQRGYSLMEMSDDMREEFTHSYSGETSYIKSNELYLMYVPPPVKERRDGLRKMRAAAQMSGLVNNKEDTERDLDVMGQRVFDHYRKGGMPAANALKIANNITQRRQDGGPPSGEDFLSEGNHTTMHRG